MMADALVVQHAVELPMGDAAAFSLFVHRLHWWWPREYTWSGDVLESIVIEPRVGGRCYERGPDGFHLDWGRVQVWEPPRRLVFTWQISARREPVPDPLKASVVDVGFTALAPERTRVELRHAHLERHGPDAASYRDALASPQGWPFMLAQLVRVATGAEDPSKA